MHPCWTRVKIVVNEKRERGSATQFSGRVRFGSQNSKLLIRIFDRRRIGAAWRRHNTVKPQINNHLSVVLSIVPDNDACEAKACVGTSIRAFDRVELVFRFDPLERFADGYNELRR